MLVWPLIAVLLLVLALFATGAMARARPSPEEGANTEPAESTDNEPGQPDEPEKASCKPTDPTPTPRQVLYELAKPVSSLLDDTAHPADLEGSEDFRKGVAHLCGRDFSAVTLAAYVVGDSTVIACMAAEALRSRADGRTVMDRMLASFDSIGGYAFYFVLRYLAAVTPPAEPVIGRVLGKVAGEMYSAQKRGVVEDFVGARVAGGETPTFDKGLDDLPDKAPASIRRFLEAIDPALGGPLLEAFERWETERVDGRFLRSIGTVWDEHRIEQCRDIVEHPALVAAVDEIEGALLADTPRSSLLVGEPGVGKSAIVARLALRLHDRGWTIFEAGETELVAGQCWFGQFEERLKTLVDRLQGDRPILWLVPDFHALVDTGKHRHGGTGVLEVVLPLIESGRIKVLGEMQPAAHDRLVQRAPRTGVALTARKIEPLDDRATVELARGWMRAETANADDRVIDEAWSLSRQFLARQSPPGNLIGLLRLTRDRLNRVQGAAKPGIAPEIAADDLIASLAELTGLPEGLLDRRKPLDLDGLRRLLGARVMGQAEATQCLVDRVAMIKAGVTDPGRPAGVFLFAGPTGTGKTETAKALAEWLFGSPERMIRIDMSELQTANSIARLTGGASGDEVSLVDRVREQPFSVVLLDEFEKAHPGVWDMFLQVFDDGRLTDCKGRTADFRHAIIILTSNLGGAVETGAGLGFVKGSQGFDGGAVLRAVERAFRKEFLNRLDRIVVFRPLGKALMRRILERELKEVFGRRGLRSRAWTIDWEAAALDFLLDKGFTLDLGARPLKRAIERYVLSPLAVALVEHQPPGADQILSVSRGKDGLEVRFVDPGPPVAVVEPPREIPSPVMPKRARAGRRAPMPGKAVAPR